MTTRTIATAAVTTLAFGSLIGLVGLATPASASGGDDVVRRGSCSGSTDWKLKVGRDDGRLEVEGEIDSFHNGQTWTWRLVHNGSVSFTGTRVTQAPSGSFEVNRRMANLRGTDTITFRSTNTKSGEVCRGTVSI